MKWEPATSQKPPDHFISNIYRNLPKFTPSYEQVILIKCI